MKYAIILLAASTLSVSAREYITYITQVNEFPSPGGVGNQRVESIIANIDASGEQSAPSSVMGRATFDLIADEVPTPDEINRGLSGTTFLLDRDTTVGYNVDAEVLVIGPSADPHNVNKSDGVPAHTKVGVGFHVEYKVSGLEQPGTIDAETGAVWPLAATELKLQHVVDDFRNPDAGLAFEGAISNNGTETIFYNTALVDASNSGGDFRTLGQETFSAFVLPDDDHSEDAFQDEDSVIIFPKEDGDVELSPLESGATVYRVAPDVTIIADNVYPNGKIFAFITGDNLDAPLPIGRRRNTDSKSKSFNFTLKDIDDKLPGSGDYVVELRYVDYFETTNDKLNVAGSVILATSDRFTLDRRVDVRSNVFTAE